MQHTTSSIYLKPPGLDVEPCTVVRILAERLGTNFKPEYLVQWLEYPQGDTWEQIDNLRNVMNKIDEFKQAQQKKYDLNRI